MSNFTPAQASAIAARGNVLVIAGAGTGKTHTLVERCLQLLRDGASLDQMLMVTFTEAAAAEMRARLRKALQEELLRAGGLQPPSPSLPDVPDGGCMPPAPVAALSPIPHSPSPSAADTLSEHLALLETAQISTLHSFCLRLVREHFHHLAIDPQIVILDERQTRPLARECLTDLLAEHYASRHPHSDAVLQLIRRAGRGSDEHLRALVWQLHRYTQTLPDPDKWFADQLAAFGEAEPTQWRAWLLAGFLEWREEWLAALADAPDVPALNLTAAALAAISPVGRDSVEPSNERSEASAASISGGNTPDQDARSTRSSSVGKWGSTEPHPAVSVLAAVLAADDTENWKRKKTELRPPFAKLFEEAEFFLPLFSAGDLRSPSEADGAATASRRHEAAVPALSSPLAEDWEWSRHEMAALVQLTRQFTGNFGEAKRQLGGVDFADLEQFALRLLRDDATGVARQCRAQFTQVCVDEYQDINAAQDAILRHVSGADAEANRFLVGDLKQSIYRFRLANPRIFAAYAKTWRAGDCKSPALGTVIALSDNFRSREAILDFVNPLFRALMRESIGGVGYDAEAELKFGNPEGRALLRSPVQALSSRRPDTTDATGRPPQVTGTGRVELHLLTDDADDTAEASDASTDLLDLLAVEREARCVALRLRALHASGHEVWDDDEKVKAFRPVAWRDMVVLMRSPGSRVESFAQEFHRAGVPLHAARGGFYEALEVSDLLNLLRLLDNPLQDLPLLAVLRSPLVAMSLEDLVALRAHNEERLFWDALVKGARTPTSAVPFPQFEPAADVGVRAPEPPAAPPFAKASAFLARFTAWRELLRLGSLTQCLERVLAETHYESLLLAEPRGSGRVANVRRLLDLARQFDPYQRQGLHRFLQFIAAQEEAELDHAPAPAPTDDAVRLMSIHQSKGLEFPVVVVAGLGTMFNERDLRGDILLDEEFGLCPMVSPPGRERRYASLPHWLARRRGRRELLGEELRLLYVALTRARDTLLLVGTASGRDVVEKWRGPAAALNDLALLKARRPLDWLRLWLPGVTRDEDWRGDVSGRNELLSWDFYTADDERLRREGRDSVEPPNERSEASLSVEESTSPESRSDHASSVGGWGSTESHPAGDLERLRAKLDWFYPHTPSTHELAKTSVTVLRRRAAEADETAGQWFRQRGVVAPRMRGGLTATQVGLAHHAFLQCVDIARAATALDLRNEAARLTEAGVLTERESAALDFAALLAFWESPVGRQVRENERSVQREVPFTARFTVAELAAMGLMGSQKSEVRSQEPGQRSLAGGGISAGSHEGAFSLPRRRGKGDRRPDEGWGSPTPTPVTPHPSPLPSSDEGRGSPGAEFVIVQGVADLVVFGAREIWLLDYKTDHFDAAELPAKVREHGPQLTLYALALERIYGKKVTRTWLHFLALGRTELL